MCQDKWPRVSAANEQFVSQNRSLAGLARAKSRAELNSKNFLLVLLFSRQLSFCPSFQIICHSNLLQQAALSKLCQTNLSFIIIIVIIIMFMKGKACFLFLNPQDEVGPSISSSVVLCSFVLLVDIVVLVFGILFVSILCTYFSHFSWYGFISFTTFCAPVFPPYTLILFFLCRIFPT